MPVYNSVITISPINNMLIRIIIYVQKFIIFTNFLIVSTCLYSITTFQYFIMLFVYSINLLNQSGVKYSHLNNLISFHLFWLTILTAFCLISLQLLQNLLLQLSFQHFKHCIISHYNINIHKVFSSYFNPNVYVIIYIKFLLSNNYLNYNKILLDFFVEINLSI